MPTNPMTDLQDGQEKLGPLRHPQQELFICDIGDVVIKDDMASMEHPIFSLSKKPDLKPRNYVHGDVELEVMPSVLGLATIWDKDVLMFAISQLMMAKNEGRAISPTIEFNASDFLIFSNRQTGGVQYEQLRQALKRLSGTRLTTTIKTGGVVEEQMFGLVDKAKIKRQSNKGRVLQWGITLSDWLFRAVEANEVLTLHPDYFRLRKPLERRIYEIARKHCGQQSEWRIGIDLLQKKSGSSSPAKSFRFMVKELQSHQHLPDYRVELDGDQVVFINRPRKEKTRQDEALAVGVVKLLPSTLEAAKDLQRGWDIYAIEAEWRNWIAGKPLPTNPDKAFLGFVKQWKPDRY